MYTLIFMRPAAMYGGCKTSNSSSTELIGILWKEQQHAKLKVLSSNQNKMQEKKNEM